MLGYLSIIIQETLHTINDVSLSTKRLIDFLVILCDEGIVEVLRKWHCIIT